MRINHSVSTFVFFLIILLAFSACDLEQEVDLKLPEYEPQIIVESYLQPGQPFTLSMVRSVSYFEPIQVDYVRNAEVSIAYGNETVELEMVALPLSIVGPEFEIQSPIFGDTLYFYASLNQVPELYDTDFSLTITTEDGERLTSVTQIKPPVPIDTLEYRFNDDTLAFLLTKFQDNPDRANWYRRVLHLGSLDTDAEQDFTINDAIANGQQITFGTGFDYKIGDTLISTIYHITEEYYDFRETSDAAFTANLSPFGAPARISTNIQGGIGIFTGITFDRQEIIIE